MSTVMETDRNDNVTAVKVAGSNQVNNIGALKFYQYPMKTTWKNLSPTHSKGQVTFKDVPCDNHVGLNNATYATTATMEGGCQLEMGPVIKIDSNILNNERQVSTLPRRSRNRTKTWKDVSQPKDKKNMSSSCGESPKMQKNEANTNQLVTWKDMSPTKEPASPDRKNRKKKRPESGYFSNDVQSDIQESREGIEVSLSESEVNRVKAYSSSPEDGGFSNDYFYDEDFIVQFDTNIRDGSVPRSDGEPETELPFPHSLTGSYTRFGNLHDSQQDVYLGHYESELSGSRTSMEISSSEREMMCSSDMLDFSSDPLFTPTPTSEPPSQHYSIDSLGRSNDGRLAINCQPKKHEYFLSFNESQTRGTGSESERSFGSQSSSQDVASNSCSPSCSSNGDEVEEICSNSFHFCQMHRSNDVNQRAGRGYRPGSHQRACSLGPVQERSGEKSGSSDLERGHSSKSSSSSRSHSCGSLRSPARSPSCYKLSSLCDLQTSQDKGNNHQANPTYVTSWKHVKSLRKLGRLGSPLDTSRCNSLPDLSQPVRPRKLERAKKLENLQALADSFHSKRHSASLLDLYQRMQCPSNPVSPDTLKTIEQILFPPNGVGDDYLLSVSRTGLDQDDMSDHDSELCGCGKRGMRLNIPTEVGPGVSGSTPSCRSHSTGISPDTVILWHGTKNFSSQFPPKTSDCGIQTSIEGKDHKYLDHSMQTSPNTPQKEFSPKSETLDRESRKEVKDLSSPAPRRCVSTGEIKPTRTKSVPNFRRSASLSPSRIGRNSYYTHSSLPDISFLANGVEVSHSNSSLFDPVQIPIILRPVIDDSHQTQARSSCPSCSCRSRGQSPRTELGSSSSGISSSSSADHVYGEPRRCASLAADLERILFLPPHLESIPKSRSTDNNQKANLPQQKHHANDGEHKLDRYMYEMHPGKAPGPCLGNPKSRTQRRTISSSSSSNSSSSVNVEGLYALTEEQSPTSPEKPGPSWFELQGFNKNPLKYYTPGELYGDQWNSQDDDSITVEIYEQFANDRKPLKSCLRKKDKDYRSRSLSNPDSLCLHGEVNPPKKPNRHSIACDGIFPQLVDEEQFENAHIECIRNFCDEGLPPPELLKEDADVDLAEIETSCSSSFEDANKANKRVSFASEVSFHSPQYTPQTSPKRPATGSAPQQVDQEDDNLTLEIMQSNEKTTVQLVQQPVLGNTGPEKPPRSMHSSGSMSHDYTPQPLGRSPSAEFAFEITRKRAVLIGVAQAAEALVTHFALARDPFDKLRLGSSAENPEISKLVVSQLCPAIEQVVEDGMKAFLTGFHVFGKIHITSWKVAEMSSEIGPYTRAVNELVKQLKLKQNLISNKQKFYAFILGLLNLRLLDFWMGYIRSKKNIVDRVYSPGSILTLSQSHLERGYDDMLLALQPLAVLPFQLEFEIVMPSADSIQKSSPDNAFGFSSLPRDYGRQRSERKLSSSYSKDDGVCEKGLRLFGSATFPRSRSSMQNMTTFKGGNSEKKSLLPPSPTKMPGSSPVPPKTIQNNQVMELKHEEREDHEERPNVITAPVNTITNLAAKFLQRTSSFEKGYRNGATEYSFANGKPKQTSLDSFSDAGQEGRHVVLDARQSQESMTLSTSTSQTMLQPKQSPRNSFNIISFFDKLLLPDKMTPKGSVARTSWTEGQRSGQESREANRWTRSVSPRHQIAKNEDPHSVTDETLTTVMDEDGEGTKSASEQEENNAKPALRKEDLETAPEAKVTSNRDESVDQDSSGSSEPLPSVLGESASSSSAPTATHALVNKDRLDTGLRMCYQNVDINANSPDFHPDHYATGSSGNERGRPSTEQTEPVCHTSQSEEARSDTEPDQSNAVEYQTPPEDVDSDSDELDGPSQSVSQFETAEVDSKPVEPSSDSSPDSFHSTAYRYVMTLVSCDPDDNNYMMYDAGEYLEVLAQLDDDWLYCANGKCEGLVRIAAVQTVSEEDIFENLHDNFYR